MSDINEDRKKKQWLFAGIGSAVLVGVTVAGIFLVEPEQPDSEAAAAASTVPITTPGTVDDRDLWRAQQAAQEKTNEQRILEMSTAIEQQASVNEQLLNQLNTMSSQLEQTRAEARQNSSRPFVDFPQSPSPNQSTPVEKTGLNGQRILPNPLGGSTNQSDAGVTVGGITFPNASTGSPAQPVARSLEIIRFDATSIEAAATQSQPQSSAKQSPSLQFLPATTFVRSLILNGADVPTGGQAQSNPLPITLQIIDVANLPNLHKLNIKDCRFLAAGWGDLSSERMLARLESLSCVIDGQAVSMQVKGYLIGEDGKAGVRGRLVSKRGQLLANSLLAGIASSTGEVMAGTAGTVQETPFGNTRIIDGDQVGRAAVGGGLSSTARTLAEYYMKQADLLYPVIETDAGRIVEVLITEGVSLPIDFSKNSRLQTNTRPTSKVLSND